MHQACFHPSAFADFPLPGLLSLSAWQTPTQLSRTSPNVTFSLKHPLGPPLPLTDTVDTSRAGTMALQHYLPSHLSGALTLPLLHVTSTAVTAPGELNPNHRKLNSTWVGRDLDCNSETKVALTLAHPIALEQKELPSATCSPFTQRT